MTKLQTLILAHRPGGMPRPIARRRQAATPGMPAVLSVIASCFCLACAFLGANAQNAPPRLDKATLAWVQTVLDSWETVCRRDLRIAAEPLSWMILYDESAAWHLNPERQLLPPHEVAPHSLRFAGRTYELIRVAHQDGKLWDPRPPDV